MDEVNSNKICALKNIKSEYLLKRLFEHFMKKKTLEIIKYNKKVKLRCNIDINDYKEYSEKNSTIDIEIIPVKNKYGKFININEEDKLYYLISFNDNEKEITKDYITEGDNVSKINVKINKEVISFYKLFFYCECIEYIYFKKFSRNNINNMGYMFYRCSSLKELNNSNFKTDNVIDMSYMFFECLSLKELILNNFNTNKVTNMKAMFYWCKSLEILNVSNFNTKNVNDMSYMFGGCSSLKTLDLSNFQTYNVASMRAMFNECLSLKELNLEKFYTNRVVDMIAMFERCSEELREKIKEQYKNIRKDAFY